MTAAIGVAVGLGSLGVAVLSTLFTLLVLTLSKADGQPPEAQPAARPRDERAQHSEADA